MLFCLGDGKYESSGEGYQKNLRIFNKDVSEDIYNKAVNSKPDFELPIAKWIDKKDMTADEKKKKSYWEQTGGYLKELNYEDAWKEGWAKATPEFKKWVLELPNFDAKIFKEITGIDIKDESLSGKEVEVKLDGKTYKAIIQ